MTNDKPRILIVDDEESLVETLSVLLGHEGFDVLSAVSGAEAIEKLENDLDVVLTDIRMPKVSGIDVLAQARAKKPDVPVVLMTAQASLQSAIQAVNQGAFYYVQKPFTNDELLAILRKAADFGRVRAENRTLKREIRKRDRRAQVRPIGKCRSFVEALEVAQTVAPTESTVLIQGESGTGKEVLARYIHELSDRSENSFLSINCGALPESLLESELFGHVKGSFTGAVKDKEGLFVAANGGTLFLDEVGEMVPATQVRLLHVLQQHEVIPVGATEPVQVNVRIVAATNADLDEKIRQGSFRSDLFYRLNVIAIHLPPLRERRDDIPLLAENFLERFAGVRGAKPKRLDDSALQVLLEYEWPGNVRELENALERAVAMTTGDVIAREVLPKRVTEPEPVPLVSEAMPANPPLEVIERAYIEWVLRSEGGNKTRAAEVLGIDPSTLYRKLARFESEA
ncbi:MAG: sigma-54-dependent Fis family transcriptional regulator [Gemmatimonadetes bacterium]|uniref:Sigma-54-dependent Fis family transcriptional regulator n=1 Tax=Candidatus Kutchimonas denitrificans TaxID=3056748 RepID=A0AAE5CAV8_9BACT|nr:sigma-54-dependent Fis family transcriptional regulator [Gemmatimonadota bacterium]NIR73773.1 sigma-54-dependent Fis family transcriptional regulator [Candidatus Kutchimonas denitrificans]NIS03137.1 sigma-54-dependent Fis family transcriptional regulator [Gemmatimonadota bacterium]NIT69038.1 sigma-54-dependent Fis family transcriptional regulator [Gemmatimonadota bacterium]NIU54129.1 response regulator [Gemmatimonadota bacterium]